MAIETGGPISSSLLPGRRRANGRQIDRAGSSGDLAAVDDLLASFARRREEQDAHEPGCPRRTAPLCPRGACTFHRVVRPAFAEIAERLNTHGGGGLIEHHPAEGRHGERLTLWMSLEGPVVVPPRIDRNPYVRLDVNMPRRLITVWEGDFWNKQGASRPTEPLRWTRSLPRA